MTYIRPKKWNDKLISNREKARNTTRKENEVTRDQTQRYEPIRLDAYDEMDFHGFSYAITSDGKKSYRCALTGELGAQLSHFKSIGDFEDCDLMGGINHITNLIPLNPTLHTRLDRKIAPLIKRGGWLGLTNEDLDFLESVLRYLYNRRIEYKVIETKFESPIDFKFYFDMIEKCRSENFIQLSNDKSPKKIKIPKTETLSKTRSVSINKKVPDDLYGQSRMTCCTGLAEELHFHGVEYKCPYSGETENLEAAHIHSKSFFYKQNPYTPQGILHHVKNGLFLSSATHQKYDYPEKYFNTQKERDEFFARMEEIISEHQKKFDQKVLPEDIVRYVFDTEKPENSYTVPIENKVLTRFFE